LRLGGFELLGRIGEGGQGIVYLGRGTGPGEERVAIKVLRSAADATELQRLARELEAIHQVQPFVTARVIEATVDGDRRFIVSEFIDGPSLQERVDARGPLHGGDLQRLAVGTVTALTAIHGAGATTITSGLIGTPSYVAPEQLAGERPTSAVDIFAWALTMFFAATGRLAFGGDTVQAVIYQVLYGEPDVSGLPPSLVPVIQECLSKDPRQRPTARDILLRLVDPSMRPQPPAPPPPGIQTAFPGSGPSAYPVQVPRAEPLTPTPGQTGPLIGSPVRPGRKLLLAIGGGVAVLALVAGAVLYLTQGSAPAHTGAGATAMGSAGPSAAGRTVPVAAASAASKTPAVPAAFAGTWMYIDGPGTFTFTAGARIAMEDLRGCVGDLNLEREQDGGNILVFTLPAYHGCSPGSVWFTLIGGTTINYQWQNASGQSIGLVLKRA
jgi:hypothetical protein